MNIKFKILIPVFILLSIFLLLNLSVLNTKINKYNSLTSLHVQIHLATNISKLIHEIQLERDLSIGYVMSKGDEFKNRLKQERVNVNKKTNEILLFLKSNNLDEEYKLMNSNININNLEKTRFLIDSFTLNENQTLEYYTKINKVLLNLIIDLSKLSDEKYISQNIIAYTNFLYAKEYAGIERAIGLNILANKNKNHLNLHKFNTLISKQALHNDLFLKFATSDFKKLFSSFSFSSLDTIRKTILKEEHINEFNIDKSFWFNQMSEKISLLKKVDDLLSDNIIMSIYTKTNNVKNELVIFVLLDISALILTIFMIYLLLKFIEDEKRLREIIDKSVITSRTNTKGIIIDVSEAFCKISGYSKEELIGNSHNMVRHPNMPSKTFKKLWETIQKGKTWKGEVKNLRKDGSFYWVIATIVPIYESRKIVAFISTREDISDKKEVTALNSSLKHRVEEEVEHNRQKDKQLAQQARLAQMGEMISMIAHQWRQPLAAISSLSVALNLKSQLGSLNKDIILDLSCKITENSKHLSNTIDDFRDFFKPNKEKRESTFNEIVSDVLNIVESSIATKNISIIKDLKNEDKFSSYPNEIKQVVLNLIKNADDILLDNEIKEAIIKISTYDDDNNIILEISDNAGGIPEDIIDKIFDPYFSTKTKKDGTGLGLYMSKTIIEEHCSGKLIASNSETGAVFKIIMPKLNKSA